MNKRSIGILVAIFVVSVGIMSGCESNKEKLYEVPDLTEYKTEYVGDAPNVVNIVEHQNYPNGYQYESIEIQSEKEPYELTVFLKADTAASKIEDELQVNADMTFELIGNLGILSYKDSDSQEIIASYER